VCEEAICAADAYCCDTSWDGACVQEVRTVCSSLICDESAGSCAHPVCSTGSALVAGCDDPPVSPSCADTAGLGGIYMAWLLDSTSSPATRFSPWVGGYSRPDGVLVANDWADLTDGTLAAPIYVTELGEVDPAQRSVPTSTDAQGNGLVTSPGSYCLDWTSGAGGAVATRVIGWSANVDSSWTNSGSPGCANLFRLYCFEQNVSSPVPAQRE